MIRHLFSIAALALGTLSANAQALSQVNKGIAPKLQRAAVTTPGLLNEVPGLSSMVKASNFVPVSKHVAKAAPKVQAFYIVPEGGYYMGVSDQGWYQVGMYVTPGLQDVTWNSYSSGDNLTYSWERNDSVVSTDSFYTDYSFGSSYFPTLTVSDGTNTDTYTKTSTTQSGKTYTDYWLGGTDSITALGACDPASGVYSGFKDGPSFTTGQEFNSTGHKPVGFAQFFLPVNDTVQVSSIYFTSYQEDGSKLSTALGSNVLTAYLDYYDEANRKWLPFASATAGSSSVGRIGSSIDYTTFTFMSDDPILGTQPTPIVLPKALLRVVITGFDKLSSSTTALFSGADMEGYGYALLDNDSLASVNYRNTDIPQVNLHIGFNGAIPVLQLASTDPSFAVDFPTAGGIGVTGVEDGKSYNDITFYTLSSADNITVDAPDWVTGYQWDSSYADYGVQSLFLQADALPAGTAGRRGVVTLNCFGKELKIKLTQGDVTNIPDPTAVRNISVEKKTNDKIYNIAGQQVSKDYKGLVIKNGKKFFNK